jgi:pyridoxamine 5'-phosphate oxidase|tara:strand:- start:6988 stop:7626 length:639 start_codon:yes stop_codon:yes gene_type:complete
MDLGELRREYTYGGVSKSDLDADPIVQFTHWFEVANNAGVRDTSAMVVATANSEGRPSQRTVLLKYFDETGFVFFTNTGSIKAQEIAVNTQVSLLFPWYELDRQIIIRGDAEKVSVSDAAKYFLSRPKDSQIAAWISEQSRPVVSREILAAKFSAMKIKLTNGEMPVPSSWGGYRIKPLTMEFWQGRENRLHDRFLYSQSTPREWSIQRLEP